MKETGTTLVAASPPGPGEQQCRTARWRPEQVGEQMAHFGNGERKQGTGRRCLLGLGRLSGTSPRLCADTCKTCFDDHHERYVPIPSSPAPHFVIRQAHFFPYLESFFNLPPRANRASPSRRAWCPRGQRRSSRLFHSDRRGNGEPARSVSHHPPTHAAWA